MTNRRGFLTDFFKGAVLAAAAPQFLFNSSFKWKRNSSLYFPDFSKLNKVHNLYNRIQTVYVPDWIYDHLIVNPRPLNPEGIKILNSAMLKAGL